MNYKELTEGLTERELSILRVILMLDTQSQLDKFKENLDPSDRQIVETLVQYVIVHGIDEYVANDVSGAVELLEELKIKWDQ